MNHVSKISVGGPSTRYVTFRLGEETYAINVMKVQEVLRLTEIAPVPGAPGYVLGIINLRGNVVTVIDARRRLGLPPKEDDEASRIVVVEADKHVIGMQVDSVAEVVELSSTDIEPAPAVGSDESSKYVEGIASREGELTIVVDLNRLLSEEEWQEVASL